MSNGYIITDTPISVDYWRLKEKSYLRYFFLTHCHADHTQGLSKSWRKKIYCSPTTANLASHLFGVKRDLFVLMEIDETLTIDYYDDRKPELRSFHVTALEADHCPGAVMFLFDGWFGRILCTGDFRFEEIADVIDIDRLRFLTIDRLYLDGTNWTNDVKRLPLRDQAIKDVFRIISGRPNDEIILLAMPQMKLGKEKLLTGIAKRFEQPICVDTKRLEILKVLGLDQHFTDDHASTRFHVVNGTPWKISQAFDKFRNSNNSVFLLVLTSLPSWRLTVENKEQNATRRFSQENAAVVMYSDHSSREELESFLKFLVVKKITLTGCNGATLTEEEEHRFVTIDKDLRSMNQSTDLLEIDNRAKGEKATNGEVGEKLQILNANKTLVDVDLELQAVAEKVFCSKEVESTDKVVSNSAKSMVGDGQGLQPKFVEHERLMNWDNNMVFTDDEIDALALINTFLELDPPK